VRARRALPSAAAIEALETYFPLILENASGIIPALTLANRQPDRARQSIQLDEQILPPAPGPLFENVSSQGAPADRRR
jgi:hypothetical protein